MQIEPPETIHFPIHSLQELQEQRGGLRVSALGSATLGAAYGVWSRAFLESFRKRKLSIGGYTVSNFENQRFPFSKTTHSGVHPVFHVGGARYAKARRGALERLPSTAAPP